MSGGGLGRTPLEHTDAALFDACRDGQLALVQRLVASTNVNASDAKGRRCTPLHIAAGDLLANYCKLQERHLFFRNGMQLMMTCIYMSAGFGHVDIGDYLLSIGADVCAADDVGGTPLHNACAFGHTQVARALLRAGADANARDQWQFTPLHEAAAKAKVCETRVASFSPLLPVIQIDVCIVLLQNGALCTFCNSDGKTPLDICDPSVRPVLTGEAQGCLGTQQCLACQASIARRRSWMLRATAMTSCWPCC